MSKTRNNALRERWLSRNGNRVKSEMREIDGVGKVQIKALTVGQRSEFCAKIGEDETAAHLWGEIYPWLMTQCIADPETGDPVFTDDDAEALKEDDSDLVEQIAGTVLKLSGMRGKKSEAEIAGNS